MSASKKTILWIIVIVVLALWTFGTYKIAYSRGRINTPQQAVEQFLIQHQSGLFNHAVVLPDKAEANGGYFVAAQLPNKKYFVFYTSVKNGQWSASPNSAPITVGKSGNYSIIKQYDFNISPRFVVVSTRINEDIGTIIGHQQNNMPFSLVKLGKLPLWVYKFTNSNANVDMNMNDLIVYDNSGKVLRLDNELNN